MVKYMGDSLELGIVDRLKFCCRTVIEVQVLCL